jgi:hypothetical protein
LVGSIFVLVALATEVLLVGLVTVLEFNRDGGDLGEDEERRKTLDFPILE